MADEDQNVRMPMDDGGHDDAEIRSDDDDERGGENEYMDDFGEEDEEESDNDDDDDNDDSISDDEVIEDEILEAFLRTVHKGDYDKEFDDSLCLARSVFPPTGLVSYHKPDNWVERNQIGLERVKIQLRTCIDSVSHSFELDLSHNGYGHQLIDSEEPIVWHEPILDEYWDQLGAKIKQQEIVTEIRGIHAENVEMKKECLAALVAVVSNGRVTNLSTRIIFDNTNLCEEGIRSLSKLIDVSSQLRTLTIKNRIDNMDSARCLSRALKSHTCINQLFLSHCDLGSTPEILSVLLQSEVSIIGLSNNNIDSLGAVIIADYLENNPPIHNIDLSHNRLNDDDAILISQALKRNTNLKSIFLHSNNFTSIGVKSLLTCVFDGSSLNAISESNHTLERMIFFTHYRDFQSYNCMVSCITSLLEMNHARKIVLALQDKDSLLQYLANVPVGLMPDVMAFPLRQVDNQQHKQLNIVYSTMRWWNMPMLYSYHHCCVKSDAKRKRDVRDC
jgi:hypothetical protein